MTAEVKDAVGAAKANGTDPLMERSMWWLLGTLPKRIVTVVTKLLSMKGLGFAAATYLLLKGALPAWGWLVTTLVLIFGEKALTYIKDLKG